MIVTDKERKASKGQKSIKCEICWLESQSGSKGPLLTGDHYWHYSTAAPRVLHRERQLWVVSSTDRCNTLLFMKL